MSIVARIRTIWRSRGPLGSVRFIASRLLAHRKDLVFDAQIARVEAPTWDGPGTLLVVDRENFSRVLSPPIVDQLTDGEGEEYLEGVRHGDLLLAVVDESAMVLHHSYVLFDTRTKALLGEPTETPLFAHCVTDPQARGQRLYPRTLGYGLALLAQRGFTRAIINCDPRNRASVAGIERAGFTLDREITTWTFGWRLGWQTGRDRSRRRIMRFFVS